MLFSPPIKTFSYKVSLSLLIGGVFIFYSWLVFFAIRVPIPDQEHPIHFYSNQTRDDIKWLFYRAIQNAHDSIFISVYGVTDPDILSLLAKKAEEKVSVSVEYDPSASSSLKKILPPSAKINPIKSKGLMHRKIICLDHHQVYIGSANLTTTSLSHHDNLVLGIYDPLLAQFLENPSGPSFAFEFNKQKGEIFLLPDPKNLGFQHLLESIDAAKLKISIAMFTLTHPEITQALLRAKKRGVEVTIAADYYTAKGASKKTLETMRNGGIKILNSQGRQLLHHKWAIIDDLTLIMGSANWTKAAFSKNQDFLFFLFPLNQDQRKFLNKLWNVIEMESVSPEVDP